MLLIKTKRWIMAETKREKFIRLAEGRTNNALKQIELLGNLSNQSAYEYLEEDVDKIIKTLKGAIKELEKTFKVDKKSKKFNL